MTMCDDGNYRETRWFTAWTRAQETEDFVLPRMITELTGQVTCSIDFCFNFSIYCPPR